MAGLRIAGFVSLAVFLALSQADRAVASAASQEPGASFPEMAAPPLAGAARGDADALLRIAIPRTLQNRRAATAFTYSISYRNRNSSSRGKLLNDYVAKYEVIFVGGLPYRRQIEENFKPLSGIQAAAEQRRFDQVFAARSRMSLEQKRDYLKQPWNVDFPLPQLIGLFTNSIVGEELVDDRAAIVVQSLPKQDARPVNEEERRALHKQVKLWIDREDRVVSRIEATLIADDASMKKGTIARLDFVRKDNVWLPAESDVRFETMDGTQLIRGETIEANTDFRRFRVDVRLLEPSEATTRNGQAQ